MRTVALLSLFLCALACARPVAREPDPLAVKVLFGPVVGPEVIAGRADGEEAVWLLVGGSELVHVNLATRHVRRVSLAVFTGERCWGLARLQDGTLWTLRGRRAVIQIDADGSVLRDIALAESHLGLFGVADRLVYQQADFMPPGPALRSGVPGAAGPPPPWSDLTTRVFERIARAPAAALNMVACGSSAGTVRPCWFPDESAVSLIDAAGTTRKVALDGLEAVTPEVLLTAENPPRPVRDAYVDANGQIWVLSSGTASVAAQDKPGGWILARYDSSGKLMDIHRLAEPARLILRAGGSRAILLTGGGMVAEVVP